MKKISFLILLFVGYMVHTQAQVGINTTNPFATLDVMKEPSGTVADGIIAPNLSLTELIARNTLYGVNQSGSFVYVTAIDATPAGKTRNVVTEGYYYFDGSEWKHFNDKLQTADNGLSVGATANVQLGGDLLDSTKIDTKTYKLTITNTGGSNTGLQLPTGASDGNVLTSDASGNASWSAPGFSVFKVVPTAVCAINVSNDVSSMVKKTDGNTYSIQFPSLGTYSITMGMTLRLDLQPGETIHRTIVQFLPQDNAGLWGSATRIKGSYEVFGMSTYPNSPNSNEARFYLSENITMDAFTGNTAYLAIHVEIVPGRSPITGYLYIGNNAVSGTPQMSGGSYIKIN